MKLTSTLLVLTGLSAVFGKPVEKDGKLRIVDDRTGRAFDYTQVAAQVQSIDAVPKMKLDPENQTPAEDRFGFGGFWPWGFGGFASFEYSPFWGPFGGFGGPFGGFGGPGFGGPGFGGPGFGGPGFGGPGFGGPGFGGGPPPPPQGGPPGGGYGGY